MDLIRIVEVWEWCSQMESSWAATSFTENNPFDTKAEDQELNHWRSRKTEPSSRCSDCNSPNSRPRGFCLQFRIKEGGCLPESTLSWTEQPLSSFKAKSLWKIMRSFPAWIQWSDQKLVVEPSPSFLWKDCMNERPIEFNSSPTLIMSSQGPDGPDTPEWGESMKPPSSSYIDEITRAQSVCFSDRKSHHHLAKRAKFFPFRLLTLSPPSG